jgi:hypothetical protein
MHGERIKSGFFYCVYGRVADSKSDINCSQNLRRLCLVSLLAVALLGLHSVLLSTMFFV